MSALKSGVTALPMTIALSALAPVAGRLADRIGGKILLVIGLAVYALGVVFVASVTSTSASSATFVAPLIAVGIGMGLAFAPMTTEAMRPIPPALTGAASGVLNTARQVGSALGAAVIGAVLQNQLVQSLETHAREQAAQLPPAARGPFVEGFQQAASHGLQLGSGQTGGVAVPANLAPDVAAKFQQALRETFGAGFVDATRPTLGVVVGVLLLGSVLALFMAGRRKAAPAALSVPSADRSPDPETVPA
jgi:MFS family permease